LKAVATKKRQNGDAATAETDRLRDALFEGLALQAGLVTPEAIAEARREQTLSPSHMLADLLVKRQAISEKARQGLELLVEEQSLRSSSQAWAGETESMSTAQARFAPPLHKFAGYELLSEIARGGMGVVFKARQVKLGRLVALKMILSGEFSGEDQVRRFYAEAEAAANLDHPNIVPVYEVGEAGGQHFYSMALIEGQSLSELVKREGPLPARRAAELMKLVAQAVGYAHDKGIVHRDLKPQNILLEADNQPKVTDFGLAKQVNSISDLTLTGQVIGTPSYMPPEQAAGRGSTVGPLADVYALGATLYFLLAGHAPFHGSSPAEVIRQVLETEPIPLRRLNPAIPRDLETICLKCLRKEPGDRYESAAAVALDLRRWLAGEPIVARPVNSLERAWL
jgi:eukaryotic-like serine/threonine-protein kinase